MNTAAASDWQLLFKPAAGVERALPVTCPTNCLQEESSSLRRQGWTTNKATRYEPAPSPRCQLASRMPEDRNARPDQEGCPTAHSMTAKLKCPGGRKGTEAPEQPLGQ
ncbi:hypothetical protein TPA0598_16_00030 [Streptomyces lydicamycinicus]|uniref:Uncharacterized protein n=1 Tax=Streptomyces lydicamycinicus TaxID=1546107 RepID=A0A0P4RHZ5_9ACTN|nr:hypothetical protein TPA0598_16_00030 [Streptomyces lydicamycinicus]